MHWMIIICYKSVNITTKITFIIEIEFYYIIVLFLSEDFFVYMTKSQTRMRNAHFQRFRRSVAAK